MAKKYPYMFGECEQKAINKWGVTIELWRQAVSTIWWIPKKYTYVANTIVCWFIDKETDKDGNVIGRRELAFFRDHKLQLMLDYNKGWYIIFEGKVNYKGIHKEVSSHVGAYDDDLFMDHLLTERNKRVEEACFLLNQVKETFANSCRVQYYAEKLSADITPKEKEEPCEANGFNVPGLHG